MVLHSTDVEKSDLLHSTDAKKSGLRPDLNSVTFMITMNTLSSIDLYGVVTPLSIHNRSTMQHH